MSKKCFTIKNGEKRSLCASNSQLVRLSAHQTVSKPVTLLADQTVSLEVTVAYQPSSQSVSQLTNGGAAAVVMATDEC